MIEQNDTIIKIEIDGEMPDNKEVKENLKIWNQVLDN